jgi:hypothetical protein
MFERDLLESRQVTLAEWNRRSFGERFLEWMHGLLRSQY